MKTYKCYERHLNFLSDIQWGEVEFCTPELIVIQEQHLGYKQSLLAIQYTWTLQNPSQRMFAVTWIYSLGDCMAN